MPCRCEKDDRIWTRAIPLSMRISIASSFSENTAGSGSWRSPGISTPESASGHRQLLTNLYADSTVAVIQLESATPIWKSDPDYKSIFSVRVAASLSQMAQAPLEKGLFAPDLVKARMGYVAMDQKSN